jgi:indolepyruvate ferredoxin oxidoreductase alpha subunit
MNQYRTQQDKPPVIKVDKDKCIGCLICVNKFGCPSINFNEKDRKAFIDSTCRGCKVCIEVCPHDAIYEEIDS